jgi:two-component sensor histidine kinase
LFRCELRSSPVHDAKSCSIYTVTHIQDIIKRKKAKEALKNIENTRKNEIHYRIKNNLQTISSLLDFPSEMFKDKLHSFCNKIYKFPKYHQE